MLSRREFGETLAVGAVARRGGSTHAPAQPAPPAREPNLARILRTRKLRLAALPGEEPYTYRDHSSGPWSGLCLLMAQNLAAQLGVEVAVSESSWADVATDLHTGKIDLAYIPGPNAQRAMFADFANPLFNDAYAIIARNGFTPKGWEELNVPGTLVAVDAGSAREEMARRFANNAAITGFKSRDEALAAVQSGRADCFLSPILAALTILKKDPQIGDLVIPTPHFHTVVCPALPYDDDRRFRGVVDAWSADNRGTAQVRNWITAALSKFGIEPSELPPDISL